MSEEAVVPDQQPDQVAEKPPSQQGRWDELGITFSAIPLDRMQDVYSFLYNDFYKHEPLMRAMGSQPVPHWVVEVVYGMWNIKPEYSMMAVDKDGEIVGVLIAKVVDRRSWYGWLFDGFMPYLVSKVSWMYGEAMDRFVKLNQLCDSKVEYDPWPLFDRLNCDKILNSYALGTSKRFLRSGIGTQLVLRSEELAKEKGCKAAMLVTTGMYSERLFKKLGYTAEREVYYSDLRDDNGNVYLKETDVLKKFTKFVKVLNK